MRISLKSEGLCSSEDFSQFFHGFFCGFLIGCGKAHQQAALHIAVAILD
jgi:hypothetical protein